MAKSKRQSEVQNLTASLKVAMKKLKEAEAVFRQIERLKGEAAKASRPYSRLAKQAEAPYRRKIDRLRPKADTYSLRRDVTKIENLLRAAKLREEKRNDRRRLMSLGRDA